MLGVQMAGAPEGDSEAVRMSAAGNIGKGSDVGVYPPDAAIDMFEDPSGDWQAA